MSFISLGLQQHVTWPLEEFLRELPLAFPSCGDMVLGLALAFSSERCHAWRASQSLRAWLQTLLVVFRVQQWQRKSWCRSLACWPVATAVITAKHSQAEGGGGGLAAVVQVIFGTINIHQFSILWIGFSEVKETHHRRCSCFYRHSVKIFKWEVMQQFYNEPFQQRNNRSPWAASGRAGPSRSALTETGDLHIMCQSSGALLRWRLWK